MNDLSKESAKDQAMVDTRLDLMEKEVERERKLEVERRIEQSRQAYEELQAHRQRCPA